MRILPVRCRLSRGTAVWWKHRCSFETIPTARTNGSYFGNHFEITLGKKRNLRTMAMMSDWVLNKCTWMHCNISDSMSANTHYNWASFHLMTCSPWAITTLATTVLLWMSRKPWLLSNMRHTDGQPKREYSDVVTSTPTLTLRICSRKWIYWIWNLEPYMNADGQ